MVALVPFSNTLFINERAPRRLVRKYVVISARGRSLDHLPPPSPIPIRRRNVLPIHRMAKETKKALEMKRRTNTNEGNTAQAIMRDTMAHGGTFQTISTKSKITRAPSKASPLKTPASPEPRVAPDTRSSLDLSLHYNKHTEFALESDIKEYPCPGCGTRVQTSRKGSLRFCEYTGKFLCTECHVNNTHVLPSYVVLRWDFKPRKVCKLAYEVLCGLVDKPCIDVRKATHPLNPTLARLVEYRQTLAIQTEYILTCRESEVKRFTTMAAPHLFVLATEPHMFTLQSLELANKGQMLPHLRNLIAAFTQHITHDCPICRGKGFFCEAPSCPRANDVLFPFSADTHRCPKCHVVFHSKCFQTLAHCPRCARLAQRS